MDGKCGLKIKCEVQVIVPVDPLRLPLAATSPVDGGGRVGVDLHGIP